jgi:alkylation response protein AidB-like acyl-CoA dehydrogenase
VPLLASGKGPGGFGLTESGAMSDSGSTRTIRKRGGCRLNGSKIFISHAGAGEIFTVIAVTDPSGGTRGISVTWEQFGQNTQELQPVQFRLSDMATDIGPGSI